jgi:hypothetical protein
MQIIRQREEVEVISCFHSFKNKNNNTCGYVFYCSPTGILNTDADINKIKTLREDQNYTYEGIQITRYSYIEPKVGICECGREIELEHFTNTCECGRDYNSSGQELAPREQWGEETGESLAEILMIK